MAAPPRCIPSRTAFLKEGFLLPWRNLDLFFPVFVLVVAYTTVRLHAYYAAMQPLLDDVFQYAQEIFFSDPAWPGYAKLVTEMTILAGQLIANAAAYLLFTALTTGTVVSVVTVSAAVHGVHRRRAAHTSFDELLRKVIDGGLKGPLVTAALCNALHSAASIVVTAWGWGLYIGVHRRYSSDAWMSVQLVLIMLGKLTGVYVDVVCTVATVVSVAEPAGGCLHVVRALRQAWWLAADKATPVVTLMVVKGAATAVLSPLTFQIPVVRFYYGMAYSVLLGFVYAILYGAGQLWFVAATTVYYYQRSSAGSSSIV